MLRNQPRLKYSGITVILSNPSRFDKLSLLTANGGVFFNTHCLQPDFNSMQCDIRLMEDTSPWIEGTKVIMLLGEAAMHHYCLDTKNNTLNEMRGSPLYVGNIPAIASFFPQDAADMKAHEKEYNEDSKEFTGEDEGEKNDDEEGDGKTHSRTKRGNFGFWLRADTKKARLLVKSAQTKWPVEKDPVYRIYPQADEVVEVLSKTKGEYFYFDIETDYEEQNLLCFAFRFGNGPVYSVPVLNHNYQYSYTALHYIIRALVLAIKDNTIVAHNGAGFDYFVLASKYHIPIYKCEDTMLMMHRCFPDIEKSLGHCISYWTYQRFHKDTDSRAYRTQQHMMDKLKYCAKDVFTLSLIHQNIKQYATTIPGLAASINCANRSIRPYLITTLQGIRFSEEKRKSICKENDLLMEQYIRIINMLIGEVGLIHCRAAVKSSKAKAFPGSNTQCVDYFHEQLGYAVQMRSEKTGKPSLGKTLMYKLALKYNNPVILFTLLYRITQKETGALKFIPWKDDNNEIVDIGEWFEKLALAKI